MGALFSDVASIALGTEFTFSWIAWAYFTVLVMVVGSVMAVVAGRVLDPMAALAGGRPLRVVKWMVPALIGSMLLVAVSFLTVIFAGIAVVLAFGLLVLGLFGYLALGLVVGDVAVRLLRGGMPLTDEGSPPPWLAALVGLLLIRLLRIVPFLGGFLHGMAVWFAFTAAFVVAWDVALSWHRRRLPDHIQFEGETLVEWYPDGDPEEGPSVGTGRPVLENLRGEEDREAERRRGGDDDDEGSSGA